MFSRDLAPISNPCQAVVLLCAGFLPSSIYNSCDYVLTEPLQLPLSIRAVLAVCAALFCAAPSKGASPFETNDVVAFLGGADVVAAQHCGHLESLLATGCRGMAVRFRNFGWEGDTVFEQPRDFGFPSLASRLQKTGVTVLVVQFGRGEALNGNGPGFEAAYRNFLDSLARQWPRLVLVTPIPFENGGGLLPDLSKRNSDLAANAAAIRKVATERKLILVDLFRELSGGERLTSDGLQLTPRAHGMVAYAFAAQLGFASVAKKAGGVDDTGKWKNPLFEQVRQEVIAKNRLWFDYSRPQNWAFLGGDRITQPSSHDHRDPKVRWFPGEMEKFVPLITAAEARVETAANKAISK